MSMEAPKPEWTGQPIRLGVIGGSGLYKLEGIEIIDVVNPKTVCMSRPNTRSPGDTPRRLLASPRPSQARL